LKFKLFYHGDLPPRRAATLKQIHELRWNFHLQLGRLWSIQPLAELTDAFTPLRNLATAPQPIIHGIVERISGIEFVPLVTTRLNLICDLSILFLRAQPPGRVVGHGGDIDIRLKTLLDALRMPSAQELSQAGNTTEVLAPEENNWPMMFCLLQDDALVTGLSIETDRLLADDRELKTVLIVGVDIKGTRTSMENLSLVT
jgi:hypothetical protein